MTRPNHLFFLHLPKTAGTVVHNVLHRNYRKAEQIEINFYVDKTPLQRFSESELRQLKLVRGHFPFNLHNTFPSGTFEYCTLLREPLDRCVSHYHYMKARHQLNPARSAGEITSTLLQLCTTGELLFVDNLQVRLLSGMYHVPFGKVTEEMLELAWKNLNSYFPVIGIQTHLDEFLLQLTDRYSLRYPYYQSQRVNEDRPPTAAIDQATRNAVLKLNCFDVELYSRVERLVAERLNNEGPDFAARVQRFSRFNAILSKIVKSVPFLFRTKHVTD